MENGFRAILKAMEQRSGNRRDEEKQVQRCIEQVLQRWNDSLH